MSNKSVIHPQIEALVDSFLNKWDSRLAGSPQLRLDFNWPSVGVIDLITFPLRFSVNPSNVEKDLLREVSAYLATFISKTWRRLNISHEVTFDESLDSIIIIRNDSDDNKGREIALERIIGEFFRILPGSIPVFRDFDKPYVGEGSIISYLVLGLLSGLSPLIAERADAGPTDFTGDDEAELLERLEKELARQTAEWFSEAFQEIPISHVAELYLGKAILPPYLMSDEAPMLVPCRVIGAYLKELGIPREMCSDLFRALSMCPDDQISLLGISFSGFYQNVESLPPEVIAAAKVRRDSVPLIREAVLGTYVNYLRAGKLFSQDEYLPARFSQENEPLYLLEKELGLMPWLSLTASRLLREDAYQKELFEFIEAVLGFDYVTAKRAIASLLERLPGDLDLRVQELKLGVIAGDLEEVHEKSKRLLSEPGAESHPQFLNLWGSVLLAMDEPEIALRYFRGAIRVERKEGALIDSNLRSDILNNTAWALIRQEAYEEALMLLKEAELISLCPVTILLNRALIGDRTGDKALKAEAFSKVLKLAPTDRRVFAYLI